MPRKKPTSAKQKKAETQQRRAVKRGDVPPPEPKAKTPRTQRRGPTGKSLGAGTSASAAVDSSRKLQSAFVKVSAEFLEDSRRIASDTALPRPIPDDASLFPSDLGDTTSSASPTERMSCPKRPKWRFDMSKNEVEKNEEGLFKKWLAQMDGIVDKWRHEDIHVQAEDATEAEAGKEREATPPPPVPRAPTQFERNLEVWRQLWRVTEISQILLVLLDCRCPPLHFPPTLEAYLGDRRVVLVLTKVDIAGRERADAWARFLALRYPARRVVQAEAYAARAAGVFTQGTSRPAYEPHLPASFRQQLVDALRAMHGEMLRPPEAVRADAAKAARWRPAVKQTVDWDAVMAATGGQVGSAVGGAAAPRPADAPEGDHEQEPAYLTIGLIGQPNVGKSSLLNALFGSHQVRASRTPGKTKHFQTLFWTPEVRLVDCPGLVVPNLVPLELQVLAGILPISRVSAVPACIHYAAGLIPLERILGLEHPSAQEAPVQDKRTWRDAQTRAGAAAKAPVWTAMDVLTAYATKKGWATAKAGRPDVNRAGNAILRALADGRLIRWGFWPPTAQQQEMTPAHGIWIEGETDEETHLTDGERTQASDDELSETKTTSSESEEADTDSDDEDSAAGAEITKIGGGSGGPFSQFGALTVEAIGGDESDEGTDEIDDEADEEASDED